MRVYFLSSVPAALYVGGAYFGRVSDFERFAELSLQDNLPVRVDAEGMQSVCFFLDEHLPLRPPEGVDVYRFDGGLAVYIHGFVPIDQTLCVITQKRNGETLATVTKQGGVCLGINTPNGFFNATLPPSFCDCELSFIGESILVKGRDRLCVFTPDGNLLLDENYLSAEWSDTELRLSIPLSDRYKRTAECNYTIKNGNAERTSYRLKQDAALPSDGLLAYAFFESIRIGADFAPFLCDELQNSPETVLDFLGAFLHVLPTPDPNVCLLTYKKAERLFDVRKFSVRIQDGLIVDITA